MPKINEPNSRGQIGGNNCPSLVEKAFSWSIEDVGVWLDTLQLNEYKESFRNHKIDGAALIMLTELDLKQELNIKTLGHVKKLCLALHSLRQHKEDIYMQCSNIFEGSHEYCSLCPSNAPKKAKESQQQSTATATTLHPKSTTYAFQRNRTYSSDSQADSVEGGVQSHSSSASNYQASVIYSSYWRSSGAARNLRPEYFKTVVSCLYMFLVTWVTAIVMVFVHDRVPDKARHPPLPDIFLDNVPHISWAFELCEITILLLTITWLLILYFHKHRSILLRRFSALSGSVFLLRCATMFITSLSVPGQHLQCAPRDESDFWMKIHQAWIIWRGGGLSIKGVRTCGDYMFSGHTTALTLLNFFITEYTPRRTYFIHIASWVLNTFGVFFILAAHEHYSIDVFIAFYITSRMFLYYHSLANNRALHQRDSFRTKIWFPMFSYFEANIDGIVPNEYTNPLSASNIKASICKIRSLLDNGSAYVNVKNQNSLSASSSPHKKKKK